MEENKIYLLNQIDLSKIIYSKVNDMNEKKIIHIFYEKPGQKLLFQTPQLLNIFDIQKSQYFSELILPLYDCNLKVPLLIQFLKDLDSKIVEGARLNKNEWFKNKSAIRYKSSIKNLYTSASQQQQQHYTPSREDEKYSKNGLIKLKITNGVKILDNNNEIKLEDLKKNNFVRMIVELYGVWVSNEVFGIYLKPVMIQQIENKVLNFIDDKEDATEINLLETEANSEDEYIDQNELMMVPNNKVSNIRTESSEDTNPNSKIDNTRMYHFGLHDVNDDLFNTLKKDKKIINILSELNSNNTKKDITLSEMSSDIEDNVPSKDEANKDTSKEATLNGDLNINYNEDESEEDDSEEDEEDEEERGNNQIGSDLDTSSDVSEIKIKQNVNSVRRR